MPLELTILGCNSATPTSTTHPTAQHLVINNRHFLIDCGEGTQVQLRKFKLKFSRITHIFISHLHGDHFFGLPGLISSFQLLGRKKELYVFGPRGIKNVLETIFKESNTHLSFDLKINELIDNEPNEVYMDNLVRVTSFPLTHRVVTHGYLFEEVYTDRRIDPEAIEKYPEIEKCDYLKLKNGKNITLEDNTVINNSELTKEPLQGLKYAFCSDTSYQPKVIPFIKNADLLYHESTFLESHRDLAHKTGHSTAYEAAKIAHKSSVKEMILGHYSNRYSDLEMFREEAQAVFKNVILAKEGLQVKKKNS